ncbi:hypothetical protein Tco_1310402 [Tanacetum coccineum]
MKKKTCKIKTIQKEFVEIESLKSSIQNSSVHDVFVLNKSEEDVEAQQIITLDPNDQPMWESAMTVAPTPISVIVRPVVDDNFVIIRTHLKMIRENKFDGYPRDDPHDHIHEFLAICDMFKYDESTQAILDETTRGNLLYKSLNQAFQFLDDKVLFKLDWFTESQYKYHHQKSVSFADGSNSNNDNSRLMETCEALIMKMDSQFQSLKYELQDIRNKYYDLRDNHASKNQINDDTPMCKRHEVNSIQSRGYQIRDSPDSYSHQSHYDPKSNNDSEKSLTESNYDVKQDLEHFKSCIRSMRTVHDKLFDRDDQSKTDLEKSITKFLDGQRVTNMFLKKNINDIIIKMK